MKDFDDIQELSIDEEFEEVIKSANRFNFPTITFGDTVYFNNAAVPIIPDHIKWSISPNYLIISPTKKTDINSYPVRTNGRCGKVACTPAIIKNGKKIKPGTYRLYKCKNGFAIKRYESLEGENG